MVDLYAKVILWEVIVNESLINIKGNNKILGGVNINSNHFPTIIVLNLKRDL